jgi:hypothetical protein
MVRVLSNTTSQGLRIQSESRLVQQHHRRRRAQCSGKFDDAALATGKVGCLVADSCRDHGERLGQFVEPPSEPAPVAADQVAAEQHVVANREVAEQAASLRHVGDTGCEHLGGGQVVDRLARHQDRSLARLQESAQSSQQRRLAGTIRSDDTGDRGPVDRQRNALQHVSAAVPGPDVLELDHDLGPIVVGSRTKSSPR